MSAGKRERQAMRRWLHRINFKLDNPMHVWALLGACWVLHSGYIPYEMARIAEADCAALAGPPHGHPERLAGYQDVSPAERELWAAVDLSFQRDPAADERRA